MLGRFVMRICVVVGTSVLAMSTVTNAVWGQVQEFRVETSVFAGNSTQPLVQTLTIFDNGVVYDFLLTGAEEMTMFDRAHNRIVLLDPKRRVKAELTTDAILSFIAKMKARLNDEQRRYLGGAGMKLEPEQDGWLKLSNSRVIYRAHGVAPKEEAVALEYRQFADWYARLNAMRLGNPPPFARLRLNAELAERQLIPKEVERTVILINGLSKTRDTVRSRHTVNWRLSQTDRKWIDRVATHLTSFPTVPFTEYVRQADIASK